MSKVTKAVKKVAKVVKKVTKAVAKKTAVKKVTKVKAKVVAQPVLPFDKKNVLVFAKSLYSDKGGVITCLKLCDGTLSNGKDDGRTLHCAVGEAYFNFVSTDMKPVLKKTNHVSELCAEVDGTTAAVIDELVAVAVLKNPKNKLALVEALEHAVNVNDDSDHDDWLGRSEYVSNVFLHEVAPLLK